MALESPAALISHLKFEIEKNDAPSWEQPAWPEALEEWYGDPTKNHFLLIDGARHADVKGVFCLDNLPESVRVKCLLKGNAVSEAAPWLVDISGWKNQAASFLRDYFATQWGERVGLFIRSEASFDTVYDHLRTLVQVRDSGDENSRLLYFRFWDPFVIDTYLPGVQNRFDRVSRLMRARDDLPVDLCWECTDGACYAASRSDLPSTERGLVIFEQSDHALMHQIVLRAVGLEVVEWLATDRPEVAALPAPNADRLRKHITTQGQRFGFTRKEEFARFAFMMDALGAWFHEGPVTEDLNSALASTAPQRDPALSAAFDGMWPASPKARISAVLPALRARLSQLPSEDCLTKENFRNLVGEIFPQPRPVVHALLDQQSSDLVDLVEHIQGRHLLLTLAFGHRYHQDPFYPWCDTPLEDAIHQAWLALLGSQET